MGLLVWVWIGAGVEHAGMNELDVFVRYPWVMWIA